MKFQCKHCLYSRAIPGESVQKFFGKSVLCPKCKLKTRMPGRPALPSVDEPEIVADVDEPARLQKKCPFCAESIAMEAIKCRYCQSSLVPVSNAAVPATEIIAPNANSPTPPFAALMSLFLLGLGQILNQQVAKGLAFLGGGVFAILITAGLAIVVVFPAAAIDAYMVAKKLKRGEPVGKWECFPT